MESSVLLQYKRASIRHIKQHIHSLRRLPIAVVCYTIDTHVTSSLAIMWRFACTVKQSFNFAILFSWETREVGKECCFLPSIFSVTVECYSFIWTFTFGFNLLIFTDKGQSHLGPHWYSCCAEVGKISVIPSKSFRQRKRRWRVRQSGRLR